MWPSFTLGQAVQEGRCSRKGVTLRSASAVVKPVVKQLATSCLSTEHDHATYTRIIVHLFQIVGAYQRPFESSLLYPRLSLPDQDPKRLLVCVSHHYRAWAVLSIILLRFDSDGA